LQIFPTFSRLAPSLEVTPFDFMENFKLKLQSFREPIVKI